jgi:hypothetical protein
MDVVRLGDYNQRYVVPTAAIRTTIFVQILHFYDPPVHNGPLIRDLGSMVVRNRAPVGFELRLLMGPPFVVFRTIDSFIATTERSNFGLSLGGFGIPVSQAAQT